MSSISPLNSNKIPPVSDENKALLCLKSSLAKEIFQKLDEMRNKLPKDLLDHEKLIQQINIEDHFFLKALNQAAKEKNHLLNFTHEEKEALISLFDDFIWAGFSDLNALLLMGIYSDLKECGAIPVQHISHFGADTAEFIIELGHYAVFTNYQNDNFETNDFQKRLDVYLKLFENFLKKEKLPENRAVHLLKVWKKLLDCPAYFSFSQDSNLMSSMPKITHENRLVNDELLSFDFEMPAIRMLPRSYFSGLFFPSLKQFLPKIASICNLFCNFYKNQSKYPELISFTNLCKELGESIDLLCQQNGHEAGFDFPKNISSLEKIEKALKQKLNVVQQEFKTAQEAFEIRFPDSEQISFEKIFSRELSISKEKALDVFLFFKANKDVERLLKALKMCHTQHDLFSASRIHDRIIQFQNESSFVVPLNFKSVQESFSEVYEYIDKKYEIIFSGLAEYKLEYCDKEKANYQSIIELAKKNVEIDLKDILERFQEIWKDSNKMAADLIEHGKFDEAEDLMKNYHSLFKQKIWKVFCLIDFDMIHSGREKFIDELCECSYLDVSHLLMLDQESKQKQRLLENLAEPQGQTPTMHVEKSELHGTRKLAKKNDKKANQKNERTSIRTSQTLPPSRKSMDESMDPKQRFINQIVSNRRQFIRDLCAHFGFRTESGGRHPRIVDEKGNFVCPFPGHEKTLPVGTIKKIVKTAERHVSKSAGKK